MVLCEGMQDSLVPLRYGPWTLTNAVIPGDDELMPDQNKGHFTLIVNNPRHITPAGTSWKPNGILHTLGLLAMCKLTPTRGITIRDGGDATTYDGWAHD